MADLIQIEQFITLSASHPVIDVRSPSEFIQGHIPGAMNIPLFDDQERKVVGTTYKQINKEAAMYTGLEFAGKKLVELAKEGEKMAGKNRTLLVHCWRGGMRSKSMVWLFETLGLTCYLLEGGYKSYRHYVHSELSLPVHLNVIGGRTGSGKTDILHYLEQAGEQVIDLEGLAHHKGSAFGALGESQQPTTEQFENDLYRELSDLDRSRKIWIEDESRNVGRCVIPGGFYSRLRESDIIFLDIPREKRAHHLVKHYAEYDSEALKGCVLRIEKKLGGDRTRDALESIDREDFFNTAMITLHYYDKAYMYSLEKNHKQHIVIHSDYVDPATNAGLLRKYFQK
ncbi:MAG: tRNA 2-selenouridine(34) synthase MnmH [Bacteroidales bacterium]|nr:tRNA 2-selenouridine(34) synthase MnmH [Bacteroidales bacterium]